MKQPMFQARLKRDKDGFPVLLPGHTMFTSTGDRAWIQGRADTMENLAHMLVRQLQGPVQDATGLTGHYDFTLKWLPGNNRPDADPGLTLDGAAVATRLDVTPYEGFGGSSGGGPRGKNADGELS